MKIRILKVHVYNDDGLLVGCAERVGTGWRPENDAHYFKIRSTLREAAEVVIQESRPKAQPPAVVPAQRSTS